MSKRLKSSHAAIRQLVIAAGLVCGIAASAVGAPPAAANPARFTTPDTPWASIKHPRRGFMIAYPASVFHPQDGVASEDGRAFVSPDGKARLLVGAFDNTAEFDLVGYRDYLLRENYKGARLDYERTTAKWFVISGVRGDTMFYERVSFTCGGKLVNSWAMLYPVAERRLYDRVVEGVARTYQPGSGVGGNCE